MCDCEELEYEDFVTMLKVVKEMSTPVARVNEKAVAEIAPVPIALLTKRRK